MIARILKRCRWGMAVLCCCLLMSACSDAPFAEYTLDGGAVVQVLGGETGLRRLTVIEADGEKTVFSLKDASIEPDSAGGLELIDLNFDGHDDIRIKIKVFSSGDIRYSSFIWTDGSLVRNSTLDSLRTLEVHPDTQTLTAWGNYYSTTDEWESRAYMTYVWYNGLPVPVAKTELLHYVEDGIYCLAVSEADPGRTLTVVDEKWIFPEALDEEKLWADAVAEQDEKIRVRMENNREEN